MVNTQTLMYLESHLWDAALRTLQRALQTER